MNSLSSSQAFVIWVALRLIKTFKTTQSNDSAEPNQLLSFELECLKAEALRL